ncbi:phosphatase PAP2 family protein [Sphingomonas sp. LaA6.9]|uniref:phosphatase PAP2 family protein n=1 Tax=Sphingomonas sp. LaA6.9 TaxID=2919914 RepID=UPI001F5032A3|nr:phosphatase PAP2 family protein [Sphingomonas sp. LaA6.9]MCJ8158239.1 phosphatase PAP2 family protein [Sphingomonas sp. LaA6.9]
MILDVPAHQRRSMGRLLGLIGFAGILLLNLTPAGYADFLLYLTFYILLSAGAALCIGFTSHRFRLKRGPVDIEPFDYAPWLGVAAIVTGTTITSFMMFKQFVMPPRGFPLDPALAAFDRWLFLGRDPWTVTHSLIGGWPAAKLLDILYSQFWFILMYCFPAIAIALAKSYEIRLRLVSCWLASWILIGSVAAWILGSAGPCYYNALVGPDASFALLNQRLAELGRSAEAAGVTIHTLGYQPQLLSTFLNPRLEAVGGISAMPSMHVAMAALFAIGGFQIRRWLGWAMTGFAVAIWIGSIHFGWHYASDGVVGAAMMVALWKATALLTRARPAPHRDCR